MGQIFYGLLESRCTFDGCLHTSSTFDPFSSLTLHLPCTKFESFTLTGMSLLAVFVLVFSECGISFVAFIFTVVPHFGAVPEVNRLESNELIDIIFVREEVARRYNCSSKYIFLVRLVGGTFKVRIFPQRKVKGKTLSLEHRMSLFNVSFHFQLGLFPM